MRPAYRRIELEQLRCASRWQRSEEGRRYLRAWSVRWAAEAVAAGMDEDAARRTESEIAGAGLAD